MSRWMEMYKQKLKTPDDAVKMLDHGDKILVAVANGMPPATVAALANRVKSGDLRDITFFDCLNVRSPAICAPDVVDKMNYESGYLSPLNRGVIGSGISTYMSPFFHDTPRIIGDDRGFNVTMHAVAPMDKHGFFSLGTSPDATHTLAKTHNYPHKIFVEVNEKMPRTYGNNQLHVSEVDAVVEYTTPLFCYPDLPLTLEDEIIGQLIAEQIPDRSCIQLGIGGVPNAIGKFLTDKKDLSVHSEMACDAFMELYHKGVITSKYKTYMPYKWACAFVLGSQELYDFVDENPLLEMRGADIINNPRTACLNDNLMTVNTTLEVDLGGQCASEAINYAPYTGIGGQNDFVQAAYWSRGGKAFIVTYSTYTDKDGKLQSRIKPILNNFISVRRADVHYVVTEYGIAYLKSKNMRQRAQEMIAIAHPDFRDWLRFEAKRMNFII